MPISNTTSPYGRHGVAAPLPLLPVLDKQGAPIHDIDGLIGVSYPFHVVDEPMTLVGSNFPTGPVPTTGNVWLQISPDGGATWQDLWIHGTQILLSPTNSMVHISVPGMYRLARVGWFHVGDVPPDEPLGSSIVRGWYGTLTHEPALGMIPTVGGGGGLGAQGPQGPQGEQGVQGYDGAPGPPGSGSWALQIANVDVLNPIAAFDAFGQSFFNYTVINDNVSDATVRMDNVPLGAMIFLSIECTTEASVSAYEFSIWGGNGFPVVISWPESTAGLAPSIVHGLIIFCVTGGNFISAMVEDYSYITP